MARIIAIDFGGRRVGLAATDPLQIIASPLTVVPTENALEYITSYIEREEVELVVVGEPFRHDGSHSEIEVEIQKFIKKLRSSIPQVQIARQDESFTSSIASDSLIQSNVKKKDRRSKKFLDSTSATIILQDFLASRK